MRHRLRPLVLLGLGLALGATPTSAQPIPTGPNDLTGLVREMAERVRHLAEDIATDMGGTPDGRHLLQDTREVADDIAAFHAALLQDPDPARVGRAFAAIDASWHHVKEQLALRGASPAVLNAAQRVDQIDRQIHPAVGLNGPVDLNALVHELQRRVQRLGDDIASDLGGSPEGRHLIEDTRDLAASVERLHGTLHEWPDPSEVRRSFADIDASWHHLQDEFARSGVTPAIDRDARRVAQIDAQLHQALALDGGPGLAPGLPGVPGPLPGGRPGRVAMRPAYSPAAAIVPLSDQLVGQTDDFLRRFIPLSAKVPERGGFIADTGALRDIAADLSRAARAGAPPDQLAGLVAALDQTYRRLNLRLNRVAKGRPPGPNIVAILQFGETVQEIAQQLEAVPAADPTAPPFGGLPRPFVGDGRDRD